MSLSKARTKLLARLSDRKGRPREGLVLVEGIRAVEEALDARVRPRFALTSPNVERSERGRELVDRLRGAVPEHQSVDDSELADCADTERPQGVLLVVEEPEAPDAATLVERAGRILVLDGIQDPGNVGTLIRTARALALDAVAVLDGSVDPWNPKAVRSSAGAAFHLPIVRVGWDALADPLSGEGFAIFAGSMDGAVVDVVSVPGRWALVVGNEGAGVRPEVAERATAVSVPMARGAESLNVGVAGAILMYALTRETV